jgi:hypothetical protein
MDTINPWLDASEVRQLAEKLIRPVEQTQVDSQDPGFDTSFIGFVETNWPAKEFDAPKITSTAPTSVIPQPVLPSTPIPPATNVSDSRFLSFRNSLSERLGAKEIFILNHTGAVIFDESHHGRLHFIARDLILQAGQPNNVRVKFGPSANLELIPCVSPQGLVILGALFPIPLSFEKITGIRQALSQALSV